MCVRHEKCNKIEILKFWKHVSPRIIQSCVSLIFYKCNFRLKVSFWLLGVCQMSPSFIYQRVNGKGDNSQHQVARINM